MQYNPGDGQGIVDDIDFLLGTNSSSYPIEDKTRNVNNRLDEVVALIMRADGKWQFDDNNFGNIPIATTDLVNGQDNYTIAAGSFLDILRVELVQSNGTSIFLTPLDQSELRGTAMTEFQKTNGIPRFYDKVGNSILLYPTPNYNYTDGLRVYYKRNASKFETTDTTKEPGFARQFHRLLSIGPAIDYCIPNELDKKMVKLMNQWDKMVAALMDFYSARSKDMKVNLRVKKENYYGDLDMADRSVDWTS